MPDVGSIEITLGGRSYAVVPQGIGRIRRKLGALIVIGDGEGLSGEIDDQVYDLLKTFVPDVDPLHRLLGYTSEEAYEAGGDPADGIDEVTLPQLIDAVQTIYVVNGADRLVRLGKAIGLDPDLIRTTLNRELAEMSLQRSASWRAASGESDSPSSSTSEETSTEPSSLPSRSPDSSISSTPAVAA